LKSTGASNWTIIKKTRLQTEQVALKIEEEHEEEEKKKKEGSNC